MQQRRLAGKPPTKMKVDEKVGRPRANERNNRSIVHAMHCNPCRRRSTLTDTGAQANAHAASMGGGEGSAFDCEPTANTLRALETPARRSAAGRAATPRQPAIPRDEGGTTRRCNRGGSDRQARRSPADNSRRARTPAPKPADRRTLEKRKDEERANRWDEGHRRRTPDGPGQPALGRSPRRQREGD